MRRTRPSKPRHYLPLLLYRPANAPSAPTIRIALTLPATAAIADAMVGATVGATAATMMPRRLQRAGKTRGLTIAFMIPTATAGAGTATCRT